MARLRLCGGYLAQGASAPPAVLDTASRLQRRRQVPGLRLCDGYLAQGPSAPLAVFDTAGRLQGYGEDTDYPRVLKAFGLASLLTSLEQRLFNSCTADVPESTGRR